MSLDCTRLYILVIWTYVYTYLRKQVRSVLFTAETVLPLEIDILMLYPIFIDTSMLRVRVSCLTRAR